MSEIGSAQSPPITPYLYYEDVADALGWLSRVFGFEEQEKETMRDPERRVVHAKVKIADGVVLMGFPGKGCISPKRLGHGTQKLYVYVDDVEAHDRRAKKAGATILSETEDTFYGDRRYSAEEIQRTAPEDWQPSEEDPKGHRSDREAFLGSVT